MYGSDYDSRTNPLENTILYYVRLELTGTLLLRPIKYYSVSTPKQERTDILSKLFKKFVGSKNET